MVRGLVFYPKYHYDPVIGLWVWWVEGNNGKRWSQGVADSSYRADIVSDSYARSWAICYGGRDSRDVYREVMAKPIEDDITTCDDLCIGL